MPGKAACREEHDRRRYLLKLKARQQGTPAVFKVGSREMLQAAKAMHDRFVSLNTGQRQSLQKPGPVVGCTSGQTREALQAGLGSQAQRGQQQDGSGV